METKYIVVKGLLGSSGLKLPPTMFIFNSWFEHSKFCNQFKIKKENIQSAGFVNLKQKYCFGSSQSLKIKSNPEMDNKLLNFLFKE
ncbi:MAG: hypothetical protein KKD77_22055 [Gammaproteobacteria bacterium]|nr:hypothetical protein [Gammaproteobacteria bacterium]MBU2249447.1 hypothetical protein [Gammaproteobacteria bacterium]MBU2685605.1 hypothetical protein [Gammaproteobacteria bacterium]